MLHKTAVKITFDEYKRFSRTYIMKNINKTIIALALLVLAAIIFWVVEPFAQITVFLTIFIVLYPLMLYFKLKKQIKKTYESNDLIKDMTETIEFYDDYFISKTEKSEAKVEYKELYEILENKTNFYLMIADNQGYIVSKANCNNELIEFIHKLK